MNFDHHHYVPCLRWKQGEYQAVSKLPDMTKHMLTPLIEVPEIGWDHEEKKDKKTIDEHLSDFVLKKIYKKWGNSPCFVDLNLVAHSGCMANGIHPIQYIFDGLRVIESQAIPVLSLISDAEYRRNIKEASEKDKKGICLRVTIEEVAKSTFKGEADSLLSIMKIRPNDCDLIIDLGVPNFVPLDGFSMVIQTIISKLPYLNDWRTFVLLGTSFPETMGSLKKGIKIVPRYEWQLYKKLIAGLGKAKLRLPTFSDYAISHPQVLDLDMRVVKPSATIRYTIDDGWYIVKGENVRDYKYEQYRELSKQIRVSRYYYGSVFSWGDEYIQECANGNARTGNLSTWRQVGTNHHIEKVIRDIASFYAS